ncbi:Lrp/AsnC family transcriptional regulator [Halopiger djelfimassiliensis]|uniref:Lrp/AsnC family transcriptional regulator n=1 Tax=Halopiger djelfimassiliensis TaxID=1293047 RepID=UPI0006777210|nr:Lrp/AsnC family transcriptional regulator [Halopiger djelfimassiliensis]
MSDHSTEENSVDGALEDAHIGDLVSEHLDEIDYKIYRILNEDGRISDTELGERVDLSRTAVRRRRKKLEDENIIKIIGVLVLQEVELSYADVQVTLSSGATRDEIDEFIEFLVDQELIYEVDEYLGRSDVLVRVWHASLQDVKTYVTELMQHDIVEEYEVTPVIKTHKAWHSNIEGTLDRD